MKYQANNIRKGQDELITIHVDIGGRFDILRLLSKIKKIWHDNGVRGKFRVDLLLSSAPKKRQKAPTARMM